MVAALPEVTAVECEQDIVVAVRAAGAAGRAIRAVGAMGSKNGCCATEGVQLNLDRYADVIAFDGDTVTVKAGIRVGQLNAFLRERGKIVPTCGEWQGATVVGSMATGSHGGSGHWGIHSSAALGMRLIAADGSAVEIDRTSASFDHAGVSLGLLGVVSTITLACVDAFHLELETRVVPFERFVEDHDAANAAAEFFASVWFPTARRVLTFSANRVPVRPPIGPRMERFSVGTILRDAASRYFNLDAISERQLARRYVDHGDRILCPIPYRSSRVQTMRAVSTRVKAMEAALPLARVTESLVALDALLRTDRYARLNAVGLRTSVADAFSLSPCHGRDTLWVDLFFRGGSARFTRALAETTEGLDGRCHWGKHIGMSATHLASQYPQLPAFRRLQHQLDPNGTFGNPFTRSVGL